MATALHLTAETTAGAIRPIRELAADVAREHGFSDRRADELKLCVHEALANVACHAYDGRGGPVDVRVEDRGDALAVLISDHGRRAPSRQREPGGMGLWLMTHLSAGCTVCASSAGLRVEMVFPRASIAASFEWPRQPVASLGDLVPPGDSNHG